MNHLYQSICNVQVIHLNMSPPSSMFRHSPEHPLSAMFGSFVNSSTFYVQLFCCTGVLIEEKKDGGMMRKKQAAAAAAQSVGGVAVCRRRVARRQVPLPRVPRPLSFLEPHPHQHPHQDDARQRSPRPLQLPPPSALREQNRCENAVAKAFFCVRAMPVPVLLGDSPRAVM